MIEWSLDQKKIIVKAKSFDQVRPVLIGQPDIDRYVISFNTEEINRGFHWPKKITSIARWTNKQFCYYLEWKMSTV